MLSHNPVGSWSFNIRVWGETVYNRHSLSFHSAPPATPLLLFLVSLPLLVVQLLSCVGLCDLMDYCRMSLSFPPELQANTIFCLNYYSSLLTFHFPLLLPLPPVHFHNQQTCYSRNVSSCALPGWKYSSVFSVDELSPVYPFNLISLPLIQSVDT